MSRSFFKSDLVIGLHTELTPSQKTRLVQIRRNSHHQRLCRFRTVDRNPQFHCISRHESALPHARQLTRYLIMPQHFCSDGPAPPPLDHPRPSHSEPDHAYFMEQFGARAGGCGRGRESFGLYNVCSCE